MNPRLLLALALILSAGWLPLAHADLGETFTQINARYGPPVKALQDPDFDNAKATYAYQFNDRKIYVTYMDGKSCCEAVRAAANQLSDATALAIATKISGVTNWTEMERTPENIYWLGSMTSANLQHHPNADMVFVMSLKLVGHEIQRAAVVKPEPNPGTGQPDTKADVAARILKSHQDLADQGDAYGELRMGLRYRDGDGVPQDRDKAREWLQKAADQGDPDAATALSQLARPKNLVSSASTNFVSVDLDLVIESAGFGMDKKVADVAARVGELLRSRPEGFTVDAKTLGADPLPGKKKRLVVNYDYQGTNHVLMVQAGKHLGRDSLVKNALK
jgi:hypothetical protein